MTDTDDAVEKFLREADTVFGEYDDGYMDADAALRRLRTEIENLEESTE
ncbi:hypothetical protein ACFR9U_09120 [Halorientalis brevis]|uniref:DUF5786 domain-containing protein n=1 Tax=Halorientalis brevis TaxID=1126241 RepID=A0ABD6CB98_9EURY|nr:hypothetical protein [Halorientalis brevis]